MSSSTSEERYRSPFERANEGSTTFPLAGVISAVNEEFEAMLYRPRARLIGPHSRDTSTPISP